MSVFYLTFTCYLYPPGYLYTMHSLHCLLRILSFDSDSELKLKPLRYKDISARATNIFFVIKLGVFILTTAKEIKFIFS
jgi:hypothetical protein